VTAAPQASQPDTTVKAQKRRPKFDKVASTTWLLAALVGLGAGATWRLIESGQRPSPVVQVSEPVVQVIVLDTNGRIVGTYDGVNLVRAAPSTQQQVTVSRGRSTAATARTRAS